jgi:hypothetical protein
MIKTLAFLLFLIGLAVLLVSTNVGAAILIIDAFLILVVISNIKPEVLENWSALIRDAQGQKDRAFSFTKKHIENTKFPSLEISEESIGSGFNKVTLGETRDFMIVKNTANLKLTNFKTYIGAKDYGNNLFVSWYLAFKPDFWQALLALIPGVKQAFRLNDLHLFDQQDLTAYVTCVHHCFLAAVDMIMLGMNQDPSKIDRKSKGFLGIS